MRIRIPLYALGKVLKRINNLIEENKQKTEESKKKFLEAVEKVNKGK